MQRFVLGSVAEHVAPRPMLGGSTRRNATLRTAWCSSSIELTYRDSWEGQNRNATCSAGGALMAVVIPATVVVSAPTEIPVLPVAVPAVVMSKPAAISLPVSFKELPSLVTRSHPATPRVRWPSPIAVMPLVTSSHRIPITFDPQELGTWSWRQNANCTGPRWRANSDANRELSAEYRAAGQEHPSQQCCSQEVSYVV